MVLPDETIQLIKLQRSNYGKKNIKKKYIEDTKNEFNQLLKILPDKMNSILDIGCGLAGVSIQLSVYYNYPELFLLDKNEISDKLKYGFSENPSFYNSFELLEKILKKNDIKNYHLIEPDNNFSEIKNIDLVVSFLAMGFLFPVWFYFGKIFRCLSKNGILICDIRKTQDYQIKIIEYYFKELSEIKTDNKKTTRIFARYPLCRE